MEKKVEFYVVKKVGKKSGREYIALECDLGYAVKVLTFDEHLIAELCGVSVRELHSLEIGHKIDL